MNSRSLRTHPRESGFALVITLVVVALLTVVLAAFLTTSNNERLTARVYLAREQAGAAARGGVDEAMAMIKESFELYPDAATIWDPEQLKLSTNDFSGGTTLFIRAKPDGANPGRPDRDPANNVPGIAGRETYVLPLASGIADRVPQVVANKSTLLPTATLTGPTADGTDLNVQRTPSDTHGWIGSPPDWSGSKPKPVAARWTEVKGLNGTVVARYAWVAEDDSFRLHANVANGNAQRADNGAHVRVRPGDLALAGAMKLAGSADPQGVASEAVAARDTLPGKVFPEPAPFGQIPSLRTQISIAEKIRFLTTNWGSSLNSTRHGGLRLNINTLSGGTAIAATAPTDTASIQTQVDKLVQAIGYHLPKFGQRFYRTTPNLNADTDVAGSLSSGYSQLYFYKLAANIRDYIDSDFVPTYLTYSNNGRIVVGPAARLTEHPGDSTPPAGTPSGRNPIVAYGKEGGLCIQEGAAKFTGSVAGSTFSVTIDYYVELWNTSDQDIPAARLGTNPTLRITRQPGWTNNLGAQVIPDGANDPGRDIDIPLTGTFRAGSCTVVTTDPAFSAANVIRGGAAQRTFTGSVPAGGYVDLTFKTTGASDYETTVIISCNEGYLEGARGCIPIFNNNARIRFSATNSNPVGPVGGTLLGNTFTSSQLGDPRTNDEQIKQTIYLTGGTQAQPDQTRYINSGVGFPLNLGTPPTSASVNPASTTYPWPDYFQMPASGTPPAGSGLTVVANAAMNSIGELGHVVDPARKPRSASSADIEGARGGARTLKIGQHDDLIDPRPLSPSSEGWAAWRLTDVFTVFDDQVLIGTVNPNGVLRDNGAALRSLLAGFSYQPVNTGSTSLHGESTLAGRSVDSQTNPNGVDALIKELGDRLKRTSAATTSQTDLGVTWGPLFERGELSELTIWGRNNTSSYSGVAGSDTRISGVDLNRAADRGREEIVRRVVEQVCTRGNTYTVYAVGQAIQQATPTSRKIVTGTQRVRVTFRVNATYPASATSNFDPSNAAAVQGRFARPSKYDVEVLEVAAAN